MEVKVWQMGRGKWECGCPGGQTLGHRVMCVDKAVPEGKAKSWGWEAGVCNFCPGLPALLYGFKQVTELGSSSAFVK